MGNPRQTQFASRFSQESLPSHAVPPPTTSIDPIMSALAQMMSKLTEVSGRLDASTDQRDGRRIELLSQPLANPRNLGQASSSRSLNVNQDHIDSAQEEGHAQRQKT